MRVLSVAYPLFPVSATSAGGAEQILYLLDHGLMERGFESLVIAAEGSEVSGKLFATPAASTYITDEERIGAQRAHACKIDEVLRSQNVDLIHFHGLDFRAYLPPVSIAALATLHLPVSWYPSDSFEANNVHLICVSESQAISAKDRPIYGVVRNGIDTSQHCSNEGSDRKSLLWLGRICPEKGVHLALRVARKLDLPLIIAGPVHPFAFHQDYFHKHVEPLLDSKRIYTGPVNLNEKKRLLGNARALLIPSLAAETSSLVAMEAASSGTPVVALRSGALPEVVKHGLTGFVVDDEEEMARSVLRTGEISPVECRRHALENFSASRMVNDYIKLYRKLLGA